MRGGSSYPSHVRPRHGRDRGNRYAARAPTFREGGSSIFLRTVGVDDVLLDVVPEELSNIVST